MFAEDLDMLLDGPHAQIQKPAKHLTPNILIYIKNIQKCVNYFCNKLQSNAFDWALSSPLVNVGDTL